MADALLAKAERRFWRKVRIADTGCWLWTASTDKDEYGVFSIGRQSLRAHRFAYSLRHGTADPAVQIHHLCEHPECVNPDHLVLMSAKTHKHAHTDKITHCKHGHEYTPENTYTRPNGQRNCRECTKEMTREYRETAEGQAKIRSYRESGRPREANRRYQHTEKGRAVRREGARRRRLRSSLEGN